MAGDLVFLRGTAPAQYAAMGYIQGTARKLVAAPAKLGYRGQARWQALARARAGQPKAALSRIGLDWGPLWSVDFTTALSDDF